MKPMKPNQNIVNYLIRQLGIDDRWRWQDYMLIHRQSNLSVYPETGVALVGCTGCTLTLDYTQRRSLRRAASKLHRRIRDELIRAGQGVLTKYN